MVTTELESEDGGLDGLFHGGDEEHFYKTTEANRAHIGHIATGLTLLGSMLKLVQLDPAETSLFSNDLSAAALLTRAYRDLRAATNLATNGYYSAARTVVRSAYESAGLARILAHDAALADRWLQKNEWIPEDRVRKEVEGFQAAAGEKSPYKRFYRQASAWAHPTARSSMPLVMQGKEGDQLTPSLDSEYSPSAAAACLAEIAALAVFACFALKNATSSDFPLPPDWLRALAELAREVTGQALLHLDQDWDAAEKAFQALRRSVLPAEQLDDYLELHPNSAINVKRRADLTADMDAD